MKSVCQAAWLLTVAVGNLLVRPAHRTLSRRD